MYSSNKTKSQPSALKFLILLSLFNFDAVAGDWNGPERTSDANLLGHTLQPGPTAAPMDHLELFKRQNAPGSSVCGYINGALSLPITCSPRYCGYQSALNAIAFCNSYYTSTGVITLTDCGFHTQCFDSTALNQCSGSCLTNNLVLKYTSSASPSCFRYTYTDIGSSILGCWTANTIISAEAVADAAQPSQSTNVLPATQTGSSSAPQTNLPIWVTTSLSLPFSTKIASGPVMASPASASSSSTSSGASSHVGAIVAGSLVLFHYF